jgi:hypothetical protein
LAGVSSSVVHPCSGSLVDVYEPNVMTAGRRPFAR